MSNMLVFFLSAVTSLSNNLNFSDVAFSLLCLFTFSSVLQKLTSKGPMLWPVFGIIPSLIMHLNCVYEWITRSLIENRGTVPFRGLCIGGAYGIITADPSKIEYMLKSKFNNFPKGKYYRERFHELLGDGIFNADDQSWKHQRQAAATVMHSVRFVEYSTQSMQDLVHKKLLKVMEHHVVESKVCIDLQELLLRFTFDNICVAAFGVDPGCLSIGLPDVPFAKAFEEATESTLCRFMTPPFLWKALKFLDLGFEKRLRESVNIVHDFAEKTVQERKKELGQHEKINLDEKSDLLSRLIKLESEGKTGYFSDKLYKDFCISFILAGRDTSSVGLAWFFWLVSLNPQVERKILKEIHDIISLREGKIEKNVMNSNIIFTAEELHKMVYLQAALSESLRLYPPVPIDFKEVLEDDVFPDGTLVKSGSKVMYSIISMARMESVWGKDCREFKPERWIKDGVFVSENPFKYAVFNGGPRLCVGKKFAYMQMKMVTAAVLLRYSIKVVEGFEVVPKMTTTLYMKNGLMVNLEPRNLDISEAY